MIYSLYIEVRPHWGNAPHGSTSLHHLADLGSTFLSFFCASRLARIRSSQFEKSEASGQYANKPENDTLFIHLHVSTVPRIHTPQCNSQVLVCTAWQCPHKTSYDILEPPRFCLKHPEACCEVGRANLGTQNQAVSRCLGHGEHAISEDSKPASLYINGHQLDQVKLFFSPSRAPAGLLLCFSALRFGHSIPLGTFALARGSSA